MNIVLKQVLLKNANNKVLIKKSKRIGIGTNILLFPSVKTIRKAKVIVVVFDTKEFVDLTNKFRESYIKVARIAELSAVL